MNRNQLGTLFTVSTLVTVVMTNPVPQKLTKLVPVPENFLDWPAFARRQVLTAMDHEVLTEEETNHEDVRHLMQLHRLVENGEGAPALDDEDDVEAGEEESSFFSSSWLSSSLESSEVPWRMFPRNIYRYLARYEGSSSIASDSSFSSETVSIWPETATYVNDRS